MNSTVLIAAGGLSAFAGNVGCFMGAMVGTPCTASQIVLIAVTLISSLITSLGNSAHPIETNIIGMIREESFNTSIANITLAAPGLCDLYPQKRDCIGDVLDSKSSLIVKLHLNEFPALVLNLSVSSNCTGFGGCERVSKTVGNTTSTCLDLTLMDDTTTVEFGKIENIKKNLHITTLRLSIVNSHAHYDLNMGRFDGRLRSIGLHRTITQYSQTLATPVPIATSTIALGSGLTFDVNESIGLTRTSNSEPAIPALAPYELIPADECDLELDGFEPSITYETISPTVYPMLQEAINIENPSVNESALSVPRNVSWEGLDDGAKEFLGKSCPILETYANSAVLLKGSDSQLRFALLGLLCLVIIIRCLVAKIGNNQIGIDNNDGYKEPDVDAAFQNAASAISELRFLLEFKNCGASFTTLFSSLIDSKLIHKLYILLTSLKTQKEANEVIEEHFKMLKCKIVNFQAKLEVLKEQLSCLIYEVHYLIE